MKKRFPALFLALALCMGLAVPAFAADAGTSAELRVWTSAENYPYARASMAYQLRRVNWDNGSYDEAENFEDGFLVVPTSEYFYVMVGNLAKDEEYDISIRAQTGNSSGVYDERLFQVETIESVSILPIPEDGPYKLADSVYENILAMFVPGFEKAEDGSYISFSAARLHEFFGDNTMLDFYAGPKADIYLGSVLLCAGAFDDVPGLGWYSNPVAWAAEQGITTGTGNGDFTPGDVCTHIQILTFLSRAEGNTKAADLPWSIEQASVIQWATEKGMIDDSFDAQKPCTRAEAVNYIWQAKDKPSAAASNFTDMKGYENYAKAVDWANEKGITTGIGNNMFAPGDTCNRAYIATFLYRAYSN